MGETWSKPTPTDIPNPNSGIDLIRLASRRLALAFNDSLPAHPAVRVALAGEDERGCGRALSKKNTRNTRTQRCCRRMRRSTWSTPRGASISIMSVLTSPGYWKVKPLMSLRIKGVIVPLLTPFDHRGALDHGATEGLVQFLIERGIKGLLPCGTTGEGPLLLAEERRALAETVVRAANGRVPVIIHTGAITTREPSADTARPSLCDGRAMVTPFYFHPTRRPSVTFPRPAKPFPTS